MKKTVRQSRRSSSVKDPHLVTEPADSFAAALQRRIDAAPRRGRQEALMIAAALANLPPLDRVAMGAELYPFNHVASSDAVQAVVEKIVRQRIPYNTWNKVHGPMSKADQTGHGYLEWLDTFRDAAFMAGIDYALGAIPGGLPQWWSDYQRLSPQRRDVVRQFVRACTVGGER
jgi:hypothetical protein